MILRNSTHSEWDNCEVRESLDLNIVIIQKTPKGQKIAIPETIVHHEILRNFLNREWLKA